MRLSEIREERSRTRLKTKRWHELNHLERARTAEINKAYGHEANEYHGQSWHEGEARIHQIHAQSNGLMSYLRRAQAKKKVEHHERLAQAFKED